MAKTFFVSDLDGTLLGADSRISHDSRVMLNAAIEAGALFSIATARTPSTVSLIMEGVASRLPYIVMTGSAMWDPRTNLYSDLVRLDVTSAEEVVGVFHAHYLPTFIYTLPSDIIEIYHYGPMSEGERVFIDERIDSPFKRFHIPPDGTSVLPDPLENAILFYAMQPSLRSEETWRDLCHVKGCNPIYYHDIFGPDTGILEVFSADASKARALRKLREKTGAERTVVFGDNINDLPMMREADLAVAVENAVAEVKEAADVVIGPNTSDSVARFILEASGR